MKRTILSLLIAISVLPTFAQSLETLQSQAKKGDANAQYQLSVKYYFGEGVTKDAATALYWAKKSAEQGNIDGIFATATIIMADFKESTPPAEYHKWLLKAAEIDTLFQPTVAEDFLLGQNGAPKSQEKAIYWYAKAADGGSAKAAAILANLYSEGKLLPKDTQESFKWCKRAALLNNAEYQLYVGCMYGLGEYVSANLDSAICYLRMAANQNYSKSYLLLGFYITRNSPSTTDYAEAEKWLKLAASEDDESAQKMLGDIYYNGKSGTKSYKEAFKWYQKAASHNNKAALFMLGIMCCNGEGTSVDGERGYRYLKKSKELGCQEAAEIIENAEAEARRQLAAEEARRQAQLQAAQQKTERLNAWLNVFSALGQFAQNIISTVSSTSYTTVPNPYRRQTQVSASTSLYSFVRSVTALKCSSVNNKLSDTEKETIDIYTKNGNYYAKIHGNYCSLHNNTNPLHSFAKNFRYWVLYTSSTAVQYWYYFD